ncbi:hypothetical protein BKA62DRAFT_770997 [Auriculariales sp. MPI-PUGE-AT-0066]|nr:hypothetical protein BKA62DRAFT_770997 [Auriculariales sp. MPI-PUGE-AT-0066]
MVGTALPLEIALECIELSARDNAFEYAHWVASLCLLNHAVHDIVKPLLYRVLAMDYYNAAELKATYESLDAAGHLAIQKLVVHDDAEPCDILLALDIMVTCPNLRTLAVDSNLIYKLPQVGHDIKTLGHEPPKTLPTIREVIIKSACTAKFGDPSMILTLYFPNITHLTMQTSLSLWNIGEMTKVEYLQLDHPIHLRGLSHVIMDVQADAPQHTWVLHMPCLLAFLDTYLLVPSLQRLLVRPYRADMKVPEEFIGRCSLSLLQCERENSGSTSTPGSKKMA